MGKREKGASKSIAQTGLAGAFMRKVTVSHAISGVIAKNLPDFSVIADNYRWILVKRGNNASIYKQFVVRISLLP